MCSGAGRLGEVDESGKGVALACSSLVVVPRWTRARLGPAAARERCVGPRGARAAEPADATRSLGAQSRASQVRTAWRLRARLHGEPRDLSRARKPRRARGPGRAGGLAA